MNTKMLALASLTAFLAFLPMARADPPMAQPIAAEQLRGDLDIIWSAARDGDPAVDRYRSRTDLQRIFNAARARINRPMTELEFYRVASPAVASLGNGHAQLSLSTPLSEWLNERAPLLPLGTRVVRGKLYVIRDLSVERSVPVGAEILAINRIATRELLEATVRSLSLDGVTRPPREDNAGGWQFLRDLVQLQGFGPNYLVTYRAGGRRLQATLSGRPGPDIVTDWRRDFPGDLEAARDRGESGLRFESGLAILRIAHWDAPVEGQLGMSEHLQEWMQRVTDSHAGALVIDIRNNGGGAEPLATQLLSYLVDHPFRYYTCLTMNAADFGFFRYVANADEMRGDISQYTRPASPECRQFGALEMTEAAFPNLGIQQARHPHFGGRVYLLVNAGSFSTSAEFASVFAAEHAGLVIGQETSGGYLGDSSGLEAPVVLPASRMTFNATLIAYHMAVPRHGGLQGGVVPNVLLRPSVEDLIAGRDLALDEVRRREGRAR